MLDLNICGAPASLTAAFLNMLDADTFDDVSFWWEQREELDDERAERGIPSIHR